MYVTRLHVRGLKLLRDFELRFGTEQAPRLWTVLLGENGRCKTSVLRAIAMAASGAARTHELADLASLPDRRSPSDLGISADFSLVPSDPRREYPGLSPGAPEPLGIRSHLEMPAGLTSMKGSSRYYDAPLADDVQPDRGTDVLFEVRGRNLPHWFVAGYGTSRALQRPYGADPVKDPSVERTATLFDRGVLRGTGFADILEDPQTFSRCLRDALLHKHVLPEDALGLELRGRGGVRSADDLVEAHRFVIKSGAAEVKLPAAWLSQGYQSTIAWLADVLGHVFLEARGSPVELEAIRGLVLIDELDLHLHPTWQVRLVSRLREALPRVQFVVTTHSPMLLPALREDEIVVLDLDDDGHVIATQPEVSAMLLTGSEIYRTFFGIDELQPGVVSRDLRRYAFLVGNAARTVAEEQEMNDIGHRLRALGVDPGWEIVPSAAAP